MELVTDPSMLEQLDRGYDTGAPSGAPSSSNDNWVYKTEDASMGQTAWEKMKLKAESLIASQVEDPNLSNYARKRHADQYNSYVKEREKLGGLGQFGADVIGEAPSIAAFASTPITGGAGWAAGAGLSGLSATGEALIGQHERGQEMDIGSATEAGVRSAGTDLVLGGAGNKIGSAIGAHFAKPGAGLLKRSAGTVADVGISDAGSAAASQAYQNQATGAPLMENVGTAALVGGAAGGAIRGATKVGEASITPEGRAQVKEALNSFVPSFGGKELKDDFVDSIANQKVKAQAQYTKLREDSKENISKNVDEILDSTMNDGDSIVADSLDLMHSEEIPVTPAAYGAKVQKGFTGEASDKTIGDVIGGYSSKDIYDAGQVGSNATLGGFGEAKAMEAGNTSGSHEQRIIEGYGRTSVKLLDDITGNRDASITFLKQQIKEGAIPKGGQLDADIKALNEAYGIVEKAAQGLSQRNKGSVTASAKTASKVIMEFNRKYDLDTAVEFKNVLGGDFNPLRTLRVFDNIERMTRSQMPNIHQGKASEKSGNLGNFIDAGLVGAGITTLNPALIAAAGVRRGVMKAAGAGKAMGSRSDLKRSIKEGSKTAQDLQTKTNAKIKELIEKGDLSGAAKAAGDDLSGNKGMAGARPTQERRRKGPQEAPQQAPEPEVSQVIDPVTEPAQAAPGPKSSARTNATPPPKKKAPAEPTPTPTPKKKPATWADAAEAERFRDKEKRVGELVGTSKEKAEFLDSIGGLEGLDKIVKEDHPNVKPGAVFRDLYTKDTTAKAEKTKVESEEKARVAKEKRTTEDKVRSDAVQVERLTTKKMRNKLTDEDVAEARKEVMGAEDELTTAKIDQIIEVAKDIKRTRDEEANAADKIAADADAAKVEKASKTAQKGKITKALNAVKDAGPDFKAQVRDPLVRRMKNLKNSLTDAQLESIMKDITKGIVRDISAKEVEYRKNGSDALSDKIENLRRGLGQAEDTIEEARKALVEAREAVVRGEKARAQAEAQKATEANEKAKQKATEKEQDEAIDYGDAAKLTAREIRNLLKTENFNLKKFKKAVDELVEKKAATKQKEFEEKFEGANEEQLNQYADELIDEFGESSAMTPDVKAQLDAFSEKAGDKKAGRLVKSYADAVVLAESRKEQFPKNPELWVSTDMQDAFQKIMGGTGSSYMGNMGVKLRSKIFGNKKAEVNLTESEIKKTIERKTRKGGKFSGGDVKEVMKGRNTSRMATIKNRK